jgi:hypothetical protein
MKKAASMRPFPKKPGCDPLLDRVLNGLSGFLHVSGGAANRIRTSSRKQSCYKNRDWGKS